VAKIIWPITYHLSPLSSAGAVFFATKNNRPIPQFLLMLTRLTDISGTHASNGLGASFDGNVVIHCMREENVDATVTQTSDNLTAINAIHRLQIAVRNTL
jgi:hypothetical protein